MRGLLLLVVCLLSAGVARAHVPHDPILDVAISPDFEQDRTLFVAAQGFPLLLRSTDGGASFRTVHAGLRHPYQRRIWISPGFASDRALWVSDGFSVHESRDAGESWHELPVFPDGKAFVFDMATAPDGALLLATNKGLMRFDHASARSELLLSTGKPMLELHVDLASGQLVARDRLGVLVGEWATRRFARVASPKAEKVSAVLLERGELRLGTEGGRIWSQPLDAEAFTSLEAGELGEFSGDRATQLGPKLPGAPVLDLALTPLTESPTLYVTTSSGGAFSRSAEAGPRDAWQNELRGLRELSPQGKQHFPLIRPAPSGEAGARVFLGSFEGLYERVGEQPWRTITTIPRRLVRDAALSPSFADDARLWVAGYGDGLFESADGGESWRAIDSGPWTYPDGVAGASSPTLFVGTPNRHLISHDAGASWSLSFKELDGFADRTTFAPDFETSGEIFVQLLYYKEAAHEELWITRDAGASWERSGPQLVDDLALAPDFETSGTLYLASDEGLLVSRDRGRTFSEITAPLTPPLTGVAVADGAEGRVLLISSRGGALALSHDEGLSWEHRQLPAEIEWLGAGADAEGQVHAFAGSLTDGLFVSRDAGASFTPADGGPQLVIDLDVARDFARSPTVLVAGYDGPWISRDAGRSWTLLEVSTPEPEAQK